VAGEWAAADGAAGRLRPRPRALRAARLLVPVPGPDAALTPPSPPAPDQFPTKAADARGEHGRKLPTLEDEYRRVRLEQAIDAELDRLARRKDAPGGGGSGGSSK
jgi:hypothetical protein